MNNEQFDYSNSLISPADASEACSKYIIEHYPLGKQLTIERRGTDDDKQKMYTFIDACIDWSNGDDLRLSDLYQITP